MVVLCKTGALLSGMGVQTVLLGPQRGVLDQTRRLTLTGTGPFPLLDTVARVGLIRSVAMGVD